MPVLRFKTRGGLVTFIIIWIIAMIIYALVSMNSGNSVQGTLDICAKYGVNSWECIDSENKNNVSCETKGIYVECKKNKK